jgi:hypothetical protein
MNDCIWLFLYVTEEGREETMRVEGKMKCEPSIPVSSPTSQGSTTAAKTLISTKTLEDDVCIVPCNSSTCTRQIPYPLQELE